MPRSSRFVPAPAGVLRRLRAAETTATWAHGDFAAAARPLGSLTLGVLGAGDIGQHVGERRGFFWGSESRCFGERVSESREPVL